MSTSKTTTTKKAAPAKKPVAKAKSVEDIYSAAELEALSRIYGKLDGLDFIVSKAEQVKANLQLWLQGCKTNPEWVKKIKDGRRLSSVDAQLTRLKATAMFGPYGAKWGVRKKKFDLQDLGPVDIGGGRSVPALLLMLTAEFYYPSPIDGTEISFETEGSIWVFQVERGVYKPVTDLMKRVSTAVVSKSLSFIGVNSDVFEGRFDDQEYQHQIGEHFQPFLAEVPDAKPPKAQPKTSAPSPVIEFNKDQVKQLFKWFNAEWDSNGVKSFLESKGYDIDENSLNKIKWAKLFFNQMAQDGKVEPDDFDKKVNQSFATLIRESWKDYANAQK
jgi:hypothetical protein